MKYVKTIMAMMFMFVLLAGSINAAAISGLQIVNLKLSPINNIVGGNTVTANFDLYNNQLSSAYLLSAKVFVKGMTLSNQKNLYSIMHDSEKKSVILDLTLPLCIDSVKGNALKDIVVEVSYQLYDSNLGTKGKVQTVREEKQLTVYNDVSCNKIVEPVPPGPVEPKSDPVVTIKASNEAPIVGDKVTFFADFTKGTPSDFLYIWDFDGNTVQDSLQVIGSYTYTKAGTYTVTLFLKDTTNNMKITKVTKQITIAAVVNPPVNTAPIVDFTFTPGNPTVNTVVQFTALASDTQNDVLTFAWDFNKDNVVDSTLTNPSFTFTAIGSFEVALTVSDGKSQPVVVKKTVLVAVVSAVQTEQQKYNDLENKFNGYEDDYVDLKNDYEAALKANDDNDLDDAKDELDDLYKDIKKLNNEIDDFQSTVKDEDIKDDLKKLEKDVKDLKQKVLDVKNGNKDQSILNPSSTSSAGTSQQSQQSSYVPQQSQPVQKPQTIVDVISTPNLPSAPVFASEVPPKYNAVKIALIIAGLVILLALIIFMVAVIFVKF